jgi:alanine racemase
MRTTAVIHLDRFLKNFQAVRSRIGRERRICVPVKADAYGHGALEIAKISLKAGAFFLFLGTVTEGAELRKEGIKAPILLFTQPHPQEIPAIITAALTPFVSDTWFASALNEQAVSAGVRLPVHIKIDTGMGRIGCPAADDCGEDALALARYIVSCPRLELAGTATHFAASDSAAARDISYTQWQTERFVQAVNAIKSAGIDPGIVHAANSGAVILHPNTWFDMVRPGLFLYGYKLAEESSIPNFPLEPLQTEPVMELKSTVVLIKKVKKGESVSYGMTWTAPRDTNIGILPVGYADGLPRLASGRWHVEIRGKTYPLAGRICMDQCLVDLGIGLEVQRWDEAVILGVTRDAASLAVAVDTIPYEITCNISKRVPRLYRH